MKFGVLFYSIFLTQRRKPILLMSYNKFTDRNVLIIDRSDSNLKFEIHSSGY